MYIGCAVQKEYFDDPQYKAIINQYFDMVITEDALVWVTTRPTSTTFNFSDLDHVVDGAISMGKALRGHALIYHGQVPAWLNQMTTKAQAIAQMELHISTLATRYEGKFYSYNVVNEFLHDLPENGTDLRPTIWQQLIGNDYIERALRLTHQYDPNAMLVLSDFDFEFEGPHYDARRAALLRVVRDLVYRGVPLHGVGIQGHLYDNKAIAADALAEFVSEIHSLGLQVVVTELDVMDETMPADIALRDQVAAWKAFTFLNALDRGGGFNMVLTWGVTDSDSWLQWNRPRPDGLPSRPLALDSSFQPKPMMDVLQHFRRHNEWWPT